MAEPTILLVDDEESLRTPLARVLRRRGYLVLEAGDGVEALEVAAQHAAGIDLLLSDVMMPRMSGRQLAERLRATHPSLVVLFMSGYTEETVESLELDPARASIIDKPFSLVDLLARVEALLAAREG
jgi:DNA-binding response OmpR family regulator